MRSYCVHVLYVHVYRFFHSVPWISDPELLISFNLWCYIDELGNFMLIIGTNSEYKATAKSTVLFYWTVKHLFCPFFV